MNERIKKQLSNEELAFFAGQTALMLESGIPLYESMEVLKENYASTVHAEAFARIYEATDRGCTLASAMQESELFPKYAVKMTEIGEMTGKLEQVMHGLSRHYTREENLTTSIKNTVRYPFVMLCIMAVVVGILCFKVLPLFNQIMLNLGSDTVKLTQVTMRFGKAAAIIALILIAVIMIAAVVLTVMVKTGKKDSITAFLSKLFPTFGRLKKAIAAERFLSVLSISLQAGSSPETAIEACSEMIDDSAIQAEIEKIAKKNEETGSLSDAISESRLFDPLKARMIQIGFMTGKQDEVTASVAELYSKETDTKLEKLLSLIEPTLICILAVIIGCVMLAIMLPLAGLMSSML